MALARSRAAASSAQENSSCRTTPPSGQSKKAKYCFIVETERGRVPLVAQLRPPQLAAPSLREERRSATSARQPSPCGLGLTEPKPTGRRLVGGYGFEPQTLSV